MRFLVLSYGAEADWKRLSRAEQDALLAQDDVLRRRGDLVAAVEGGVTVRSGGADVTEGPFARADLPLAGFGVIEARDLDEAISLVATTPCAVAGGAVELWAIRGAGA